LNEPIRHAESEREARERADGRRRHRVQINDDHFSGQREQRDQDHDPRLDDAALSCDHVLKRVIELQGESTVMMSPNTTWKTVWSSGLSERSTSVSATLMMRRHSATTMTVAITNVSTKATVVSKR